MASSNPYIRDVLVVDDRVQQFYKGFSGAGPVFLIGREVRLAPGFLFQARTVPLVIVADFFDGNGGVIDARGPDSGVVGTTGANGVTRQPSMVPDPSGFDRPIEAGGPGEGGGTGGVGGTGNTVTIYARRTANVNLTVQGGRGGPGGNGGNGSGGVHGIFHPARQEFVDLTPDDPTDPPQLQEIPEVNLPGTPGGDGGPGGTGGTGGTGGVIRLTSVVDDTAPQLACHGGEGGPGGLGGAAGPDGALSPVGATPGSEGSTGGEGGLGTIDHRNVSEADYVAGLRPVLDSPHGFANHWAPYRIVVAEYFYRRYNPAVVEDSGLLALAALELQRALELQPDNNEALRLHAQLVGVPRTDEATGEVVWVGGGNNALGLPPDYDVVPRFEDYIEPFAAFGSQVLDFLEIGADALVGSTTIEGLRQIVAFQTDDARAVQQNLAGDLAVAETEKRLATDEASFADKRLQQTQQEITAALAEMQDEPFTIGAFVGTLAEVAVAVAAVAAAVGTGGAALVALVPAAVALAGTVYEQGGPVLDAVFEGKDPDTAGIEKAYEKVGKKPDQVITAGKKVIDFVKVIEKLNAKATPDNAKHLALVTRAAELAHQVLLASHKVTLAEQRLDNARAKLTRAAAVVKRGEDLEKAMARDVESVRKAGLFAVSVAESRADALLDMAFRAQRSVEIYTLLPQVGNVHLDAGSLHPDVWRQYGEGEIDSPALHLELTRSWGRLLQPIQMQSDYVAFFTPAPDLDLLRLTFDADDPQLEALRTTGGFTFRVDPLTIPAARHDAKIQSVQLAFVGAAHPDLQVSCEVRHGGRYEQRRADGSVDVQLLRPQVGIRRARFDPIPPDTTVTDEPPLSAPQSLAFWGRGIGGDWEVEVVEDAVPALNLDGLTRIQVWVGYQFRR